MTDKTPDDLVEREHEPSAFAWIMGGTLGVVVAGGLAKALLDRRRARAHAQSRVAESDDTGGQSGVDSPGPDVA